MSFKIYTVEWTAKTASHMTIKIKNEKKYYKISRENVVGTARTALLMFF